MTAAAISDELAFAACQTDAPIGALLQSWHQRLSSIRCDGELTVSRPEGFAYYALHPLDFADAVSAARLEAGCACVIGIRTIGTTLSAVVAAKLNADGILASRTTVRPQGHPYDRQTSFADSQRAAIKQVLSRGGLFLVCDEGPGRSGSSLLSVAEALEREGVSSDHIVLFCSHLPDLNALCAENASERWRRYRSVATGMTKRLPGQAGQYVGGGEWRTLFIPRGQPRPPAWPQMERLKFLSCDRQMLFKFEGHGPYGEAVRRREHNLAASGFGAPYLGHDAGFGIHQLVGGNPADTANPCRSLLTHVAKYCAWRATEFATLVSQESICRVEHMAAFNLEQEFGFAPKLHLELERPTTCDGRMQPCKWRELGGQWIKFDASTHGDDHFFPGPTDIAWDLAGVCVEWQLGADSRQFLLSQYRRMSGDNAAVRLLQYEIAYAAFRLGWSRMAAASVVASGDEGRLLQDAARYRAVLDRILVANAVSL